MKFTRFVVDRKVSILCFCLLMVFISAVIALDGAVRVSAGNILYLNLVAIVFFSIYGSVRYFYIRSYYNNLADTVERAGDEIINRLPEPKSYEQQLLHGVLASLYREQSAKLAILYEQKKDYEEFITFWVHQVKTPLSVSRLLIENNARSPGPETMSSLDEELAKIENCVEQALYHSKIDDFSRDYLIQDTDVERLVNETVKKQAKTFIHKKIAVFIENTEMTVTTDKKWLSFILEQVLTNALKYTSPGGKIKIYGLIDDKSQRLVIEDNGAGVKPEDLERVFDKGFTGYNGRVHAQSTGIGLYLSKKLARKLGHDIVMESHYGEYTRLTILFPRLQDYFRFSDK